MSLIHTTAAGPPNRGLADPIPRWCRDMAREVHARLSLGIQPGLRAGAPVPLHVGWGSHSTGLGSKDEQPKREAGRLRIASLALALQVS